MSPNLKYEDYTIGWICALPLEATAAMFMLDTVHEGHFPWKKGQETVYTAGCINGRNVIIACLSKGEYGIGSAARVVSQMRLSFPNLAFGLMVGIGAGVPSQNRDIRLGDVAVSVPESTSGGIVGYDLGKETIDDFQLKGWCNATDPALRSAISQIEARAEYSGNEFGQYLKRLEGDEPRKKVFKYPGSSHDLLYHAERVNEIILRPERDHQEPKVHYGLIASGDKVIKNAKLRDELRDRHDIICLEMEAAGLMNSLPVAVIRGICDYADSHKNDLWQPYAAAVAAAYARGLLDAFGSNETTPSENTMHVIGTQAYAHETMRLPKPQVVAISTVPFARDSKNFVGRGDLLAAIEKGFELPCCLVLVGLGGIGKSQLAIEFSYRLREREPNTWVFWVHVNTPARFKQSFAEIARKVNLPKIEHPEHDSLQEVTNWFSNKDNGRWLLILDNCDDFQVLQTEVVGILATPPQDAVEKRTLMSYIPRTENSFILATSRSKEAAFALTDNEDNHINVAPLTHREAVKLFHSKLPKDKSCDEDIAMLAEELGYLPLAIKQAGAYMHNTRMEISKYLDYFRQNESIQAKFLLSDLPDNSRDADLKNSIISTWQISFDQILKQRKAAADLLSLMSSFDRQSIPKLLLLEEESDAKDSLAEIEFDENIAVLENYSLVTKLDDKGFTMHRLVQFSTQKWLQRQKTELQWQERALNILSREFPTDAWENWTLCELLYPHAQLMIGRAFQGQQSLLNLATVLHLIGMYDKQQGRFAAAYESVKKAYEILKEYLGRENEVTIKCLDSLGTILEKTGKWAEAETIHRETLGLRQKIWGDDNIQTLGNINSLGVDLMNQGKYNDAEKLLREAMGSEEKLVGIDSLELQSCMNHLGAVLGRQGKFEEAAKLHRRVLEIQICNLGHGHPLSLETADNLGQRLTELGQYKEGEEKLSATLKAREKILGPEHPDTLATLVNLSGNLEVQGKHREAEAMLEGAMKLLERVVGAEHPTTLEHTSRLGESLRLSGKVQEAIVLLQNTFEKAEKTLGPKHLISLNILSEIGMCYSDLENFEESEKRYRETLAILESTVGSSNISTMKIRMRLSQVLALQNKVEEAEWQAQQNKEFCRLVFGDNHPKTLQYDSWHAGALGDIGEFEKSFEEYRKAIVSQKALLGDLHPRTNASRHNLACDLISRGLPSDLKEAEDLEKVSYNARLQTFGNNNPEPIYSLGLLSQAIFMQGRLDEAETLARLAFEECRRLLDLEHRLTGNCAWNFRKVLEAQGKPLDSDLSAFFAAREATKDDEEVIEDDEEIIEDDEVRNEKTLEPLNLNLVSTPWLIVGLVSICLISSIAFRMRSTVKK